ncbi:MAG: hypothetical protein Q9217_000995 [Psora testacea]
MARQRAGSRISFRKSSSSSIPRVEAAESPQEKAKFHLHTKADPSKAINEAQPVDVANAQPTTGTSIRDIEHRDQDGNLIGHQPTRRGVQATNDGGGYYGGTINNSRPGSYYENGTAPGTPYYGVGSRRFGPRNNSDPALYGNNVQQAVYPSHGHQQSYDTVGTVSNGSHVTDQWGNSTDPSSENSSIDRVQPAQPAHKPDLGEAYGFNGFGGAPQFQGPILEEHGQGAPGYGQPGYGQSQTSNGIGYPYQGNGLPPNAPPHGTPVAPPKEGAPARAPIKLGVNNLAASRGSDGPQPPVKNDKRRSWLGKRFSRG